VKYVGACHLAFLGLRALLQKEHSPEGSKSTGIGLARAFWRAVLTNVSNPKVALFFLALLPQFVRPERGNLFLQFVTLGLIVAAMGLSFSSVLAVTAGSVSAWLRNPWFARWQGRLTGSVLLGLGVRLALSRRN